MAIDSSRRHLRASSAFPSRDREGAASLFRILLLVCFGLLTGCSAPDLAGRTEEEPPQPFTEVQVADPQTSSQLLSGWYNVEQNAWRWTAGKFAVMLRPPIGAAAKGAVLTFHFTLPAIVISRLGSVTLSASIQGSRLAPQIYRTEGPALYSREVPPGLLSGDTVRIDFALDKVMVPGKGDTRQLGVVADRVGLESK